MPAERKPRNAAGATNGGQGLAADRDATGRDGEPDLADKIEELEAMVERMAVRQRALIRAIAANHGVMAEELQQLLRVG